jgi:membrane protease YdiL (CAAX protease family)
MTSVPSPYPHPGSPPLRPELPDGAPPPSDEPPAGRVPRLGVPAWAPLLGVLFVAVGYALISIIVGAVIGVAGGNIENLQNNQALTIGLTLALDAVLIAAPIVIVMWLSGRRPDPAAFGLRVPAWRSAAVTALVVYIGFWAVTLVVALIFGNADDQDIVVDLKAEHSLPVLAGFVVMTCLVAPLAEEFFFRGFLFKVLWERTNVTVATIATGAAFGLVHKPGGDWIGVTVLALLGAGLCLLFWRTASLLPCIMLHSFHNSISFGFTKELPWWGFLLLTAGSVATTLCLALMATRLGRRAVGSPPVPA